MKLENILNLNLIITEQSINGYQRTKLCNNIQISKYISSSKVELLSISRKALCLNHAYKIDLKLSKCPVFLV